MAVAALDPLHTHLTHRDILAAGLQPLYVGRSWRLRFQVRRKVTLSGVASSEAVTLAGASAVFTIRAFSGGPTLLTRTAGVAVTGASPAVNQITLDGDQTAENTTNDTGKGWLEIAVENVSADRLQLLAAVGMRHYNLDVTLANLGLGEVQPAYAGRIEIGPE